jgi:hypothetical protein
MKILLLLLAGIIASGCVSSGLTITITPSRIEERVTRDGNVKLMCPTVAMAYTIADGGVSSPYCQFKEVIAPSIRSYYQGTDMGRTTIMAVGSPSWFWPEPGVITERQYRRK